MENEQIGFFDDDSEQLHTEVKTIGKLDVAKLDFVEGRAMTWQELFTGFSTLYAITYSSGMNFVCKLVEMFDNAEIIFGCENVMSYSLNEVMAFQTVLIDRIRTGKSKDRLIDKIENGSLRLYVTRKKLSHEKIYLLSAEDGRKRVVMGSANMSYQAFGGLQRENISYIDGDAAYDWYMQAYNSLREDCTDEITGNAILVSDSTENLDELPVSQTVKIKKALAIVPEESEKENVEFALDVSKLSVKLQPLKPKADKKGKILLSPTTIVQMRSKAKEDAERERETRKEYPQLVIDAEGSAVYLNEEKLDLSPSEDDIKNDISLFLQYMDGYKMFHGDYENMQKRYFEFANWFFCSPFMGTMRDTANRYNQQILPYPVFGLIYGQSKAGKTTFLETLLKMMIGQKTKIAASEFTRKTIDGLRYEVKGAPIIVDDLTSTRFNAHAVETIKNDIYGFSDHNTNYPAVVISANEDVKAVAQEIIRRTVICNVRAGLTNTEVMKSNVVRKVQKNIGTAFYREYLRRMLDMLPELIESMKDDDSESSPDILKLSSEIIYDIFEQYTSESLPEYIHRLSLQDYFGEKVTGSNVINTIRTAWNTSKNQFVIDKKNNKLRYNAGQTYDADRIVKELPEMLIPRKSREWVIMDLDEAREFFDIDFKISIIDKLKG